MQIKERFPFRIYIASHTTEITPQEFINLYLASVIETWTQLYQICMPTQNTINEQ